MQVFEEKTYSGSATLTYFFESENDSRSCRFMPIHGRDRCCRKQHVTIFVWICQVAELAVLGIVLIVTDSNWTVCLMFLFYWLVKLLSVQNNKLYINTVMCLCLQFLFWYDIIAVVDPEFPKGEVWMNVEHYTKYSAILGASLEFTRTISIILICDKNGDCLFIPHCIA